MLKLFEILYFAASLIGIVCCTLEWHVQQVADPKTLHEETPAIVKGIVESLSIADFPGVFSVLQDSKLLAYTSAEINVPGDTAVAVEICIFCCNSKCRFAAFRTPGQIITYREYEHQSNEFTTHPFAVLSQIKEKVEAFLKLASPAGNWFGGSRLEKTTGFSLLLTTKVAADSKYEDCFQTFRKVTDATLDRFWITRHDEYVMFFSDHLAKNEKKYFFVTASTFEVSQDYKSPGMRSPYNSRLDELEDAFLVYLNNHSLQWLDARELNEGYQAIVRCTVEKIHAPQFPYLRGFSSSDTTLRIFKSTRHGPERSFIGENKAKFFFVGIDADLNVNYVGNPVEDFNDATIAFLMYNILMKERRPPTQITYINGITWIGESIKNVTEFVIFPGKIIESDYDKVVAWGVMPNRSLEEKSSPFAFAVIARELDDSHYFALILPTHLGYQILKKEIIRDHNVAEASTLKQSFVTEILSPNGQLNVENLGQNRSLPDEVHGSSDLQGTTPQGELSKPDSIFSSMRSRNKRNFVGGELVLSLKAKSAARKAVANLPQPQQAYAMQDR